MLGTHISLDGRLQIGHVYKPSLSAQAAALALCQCLAVESTHPSSPGCEDCSSSEATTPVSIQHIHLARAKKRRQSPAPALPIVVQLMEMGFPRKNIEFALKSLTGTSGNASGLPGMTLSCPCSLVGFTFSAFGLDCSWVFLFLGVEALVGWLLDHSDVQVTEFSDAETVSDEYSDEEVVEDVDDTPYPVVSSFHVSCLSYMMILICYLFPSLKRTKASLVNFSIRFTHNSARHITKLPALLLR